MDTVNVSEFAYHIHRRPLWGGLNIRDLNSYENINLIISRFEWAVATIRLGFVTVHLYVIRFTIMPTSRRVNDPTFMQVQTYVTQASLSHRSIGLVNIGATFYCLGDSKILKSLPFITWSIGFGHHSVCICDMIFLCSDHTAYALSQWGMALRCNALSHWLGAFT